MSRGVRREGLSRRHRFRGPDAFRPLLRASRKLTGTLAVLHIAPAAASAARFGVSIGRRAAKKAVVRNRIKRLAREAYRHHVVKQSPIDIVLTFTSRFDASQPGPLLVELVELLDRARARLAA